MPKLWFVATYGDLGLLVEFFDHPLEYGRAVRTAMREHARDDIDTYTCGDAAIWPPRKDPT